ncbi:MULTISPECIES: glycosyltransferase family 2 protein [unclassified Pseudarthrobacter]|uniref:glycosyltransferase family 2 protein n=1 Tax=unclassified Pseudarthrobacter TaxID=2647000 RepID=UPI0030781661
MAYQTPIELLDKSIESVVAAATYADASLEVIVANNGFFSKPLLSHQNVIVTGDGTNLGFGRAVNQAIDVAQGNDVLLMNPDSVIELSAIAEILAARRIWPARAFYGALLINNGVPQVHAYNVWWSSAQLLLFKRAWRRKLDQDIHIGAPVSVKRLCGAGLFGNRSDFSQLGPFDDDFFLYGEDVDFSLRAQKADLATVLVPKAIIQHDAGTSSGDASSIVERARTDAYFRYSIRHSSTFLAYAGRLESVVVALVGSIRPGQSKQVRLNRLSRLREIKRWGFRSHVGRFDPSRH